MTHRSLKVRCIKVVLHCGLQFLFDHLRVRLVALVLVSGVSAACALVERTFLVWSRLRAPLSCMTDRTDMNNASQFASLFMRAACVGNNHIGKRSSHTIVHACSYELHLVCTGMGVKRGGCGE